MSGETQTGILGATSAGEEVHVNLSALIGSHACIVANSGGGKSGLIRRLVETVYGRVQIIMLDGEDEFYTLRERYSFVIAGGEGGDVPAKVTNAKDLAIGALTHGFSLICQLNDLGHAGAPQFILDFLTALVDSPRALWHPVLIVVDETQRYAPRIGSSVATAGIQDLLSRGRKRGFTAVLAGTKLTDIDPSVRGGVNNWMFGRVGQALDRNTMADALGFTPKEGRDRLRAMPTRQFWGFGPAISDEPILFRVADVETTPIHAGQAKVPTPPAPEALREILSGLAKPEPEEDAAEEDEVGPAPARDPDPALLDEISDLRDAAARDDDAIAELTDQRELMRAAALKAAMRVRAAVDDLWADLEEIAPLNIPVLSPDVELAMSPAPPAATSPARVKTVSTPGVAREPGPRDLVPLPAPTTSDGTMGATAAAFADMLDRISPARVTWATLAALTKRKARGGNFNTARKQLRESGRMVEEGGKLRSSKPGPRGLSRRDIQALWRGVLTSRAPEVFDLLGAAVNPMTKDEIGEALGLVTRGGNWNGIWAQLRNNDLIEGSEGGGFQLATRLPGER